MRRTKFYWTPESNCPNKETDGWQKGKDWNKYTGKDRTPQKTKHSKEPTRTRISNYNWTQSNN